MLEDNLRIAFDYAEKVLGTKYSYWTYTTSMDDNEPMWDI